MPSRLRGAARACRLLGEPAFDVAELADHFSDADRVLEPIHESFKRLCPEGDLRIMIVTHLHKYQIGKWIECAESAP
jgi:hypothetical protein